MISENCCCTSNIFRGDYNYIMVNRSFRADNNEANSFIPSYSGTKGSIATHSNLSATTAFSILNIDGGNAFDAAAGAMLVEDL